jgi:hypothetical protein
VVWKGRKTSSIIVISTAGPYDEPTVLHKHHCRILRCRAHQSLHRRWKLVISDAFFVCCASDQRPAVVSIAQPVRRTIRWRCLAFCSPPDHTPSRRRKPSSPPVIHPGGGPQVISQRWYVWPPVISKPLVKVLAVNWLSIVVVVRRGPRKFTESLSLGSDDTYHRWAN